MKFSVQTASIPEWSPAAAVRRLASQGWNGVEWSVVDDPEVSEQPTFWQGNRATWPFAEIAEKAPAIADLTRRGSLDIACVSSYVETTEPERIERILAATASMGAALVRICLPPVDLSAPYERSLAETRGQLRRLADRAAEHGVRAVIELHFETIAASASAAMRLLGDLDPAHIGVIHDIGNLVVEGWEEPLMGLKILGEHLAHVHVKNVAWTRAGSADQDGRRPWSWRFVSMPDGQADVFAYFRALREVGYDGWVSSEDFSSEAPLEQRTAENLAYLQAAARAAEFDGV